MDSNVPDNLSIGFIGAGNMASAMIKGFTQTGLVKSKNITTSNRFPQDFNLVKPYGVNCTTNNKEVVDRSRVVFLSVKPHIVPAVLSEIRDHVSEDKLIISVAGGLTLSFIESMLPPKCHVIRVMPNTPCMVLSGATVYSPGSRASNEEEVIVQELMSSCGICEKVPEKMIDAVTGMSGGGPAYMFTALDALADGGVKMGIPKPLALKMACQTMIGAAKMVLELNQHPSELRDNVCSPGGTTIAGMHALEERNFRGALMSAVEAAAKRSKEISESYNSTK